MSKAKVNGKTIYIGANMSAVGNALKDVEEKSKATKNELKTLEKALKLDPQNVEMLTEKQKALTERISQSKEQLERLRSVSARVKADYENGTIDRNQYLNFRTSIAETEAELKRLNTGDRHPDRRGVDSRIGSGDGIRLRVVAAWIGYFPSRAGVPAGEGGVRRDGEHRRSRAMGVRRI